MAPHQRALTVPGAFGARGPQVAGGWLSPAESNWTVAQYDAAMERIAWAYYNWTASENRLVGMTPWHWWDDPHSHGQYSYGVEGLNRTKAAYLEIARLFRRGAQ